MRHRRILAALLILGAVAVMGCSTQARADEDSEPPASVAASDTDGLSRITLSARAAERIGLETVQVRIEIIGGVERLVVPYSAVIYHLDGLAWTYAAPEPLVFVRQRLEIDYVDGDDAVLVDGPVSGTDIVMVGAAELYGIEFGVGR